MKTSPGSPAAKFGMISGHPGSQVLKMANGIPNEKMVLTMG
jgi:hypothetical protein